MKIRMVKKAARMFREDFERVKPCHWRIIRISWAMSLRQMDPFQRYAVQLAVRNIGDAVRAHARKYTAAKKPHPMIAETGPELILDARGNIRGVDGRLYDINLNYIPE